jgi:hypothetical protein
MMSDVEAVAHRRAVARSAVEIGGDGLKLWKAGAKA